MTLHVFPVPFYVQIVWRSPPKACGVPGAAQGPGAGGDPAKLVEEGEGNQVLVTLPAGLLGSDLDVPGR